MASNASKPGAGDGTLPKSQATEELGLPGLKGGRPVEGYLYEEFLPQLRGLNGARIYRQMMDNDPVLGAALYAITMLLRSVKWTIEPAEDSSAGLAAKEWAESVWFKDMRTPFGDVITDILSFLGFGYAPAEVVYKVRNGTKRDPNKSSQFEDGTYGLAKIAVRSQETIWRWHFDEFGDVQYLEQFIMGAANAMIPAEKLLFFRTVSTLNNPEGRSVLRNSYIPFLRKSTVEEAEGRSAIRSAGIVRIKIPGKFLDASASGDDKAVALAWKTIGDKLAQDRMGSVLMPSDVDTNGNPLFDLDYVVADGRRPTDMTAIVERIDKRMLSSVLADFILLGQQSAGSFALSSDKTDLFAKAGGAYLGIIEDQFNRVQMSRLWALNAFKSELQPRLKAGDLAGVDLDKLGVFILRMSQAGSQMFPDPQLEAELRGFAGLKTPTEQG